MNSRNWPWLLALVLPLMTGVARAADQSPAVGQKRAGSLIDPPEAALRKFAVMPGLKVDLYAAEPDVRNPVAVSVDGRGRVFVVESDRRRSSVFDIRGHKDWLETDLSFRTVRERAEFLKQQVSPTNPAVIKRLVGGGGNGNLADFNSDGVIDWHDLEVQSERIRLLQDTDGDGRADRASVFADGFTNIAAGVAAGVLAHGDDVYFACIPDLWRITRNGRTSLLSGFGVHIAFGGHDMHGLIMGPDGRLYWSIADRGTDTNLFSKIKNPIPGLTPELLADSGCIFRANPDGSDFEVIAWGLRNPQELAFDEFGNLFTADNNGDGGDKARWHYVVEGADFGWRIGWQWLEARAYQPKMGPWNGERLWHLAESNTAAYLLPALAHIGHGPAGLAYNPGTGLPSKFDRHFFLCDFPGHVLVWTNIPHGASFRVGPVENFFGDLGPTDVAFHPDGGVLVSDWFKSFDKSDKGRIYRIHDPVTDASKSVKETKRLLAEGTVSRSAKELVRLLSHTDSRVRMEAQFALAKAENFGLLSRTAFDKTSITARLHAIAAMGQIVRTNARSELVREMELLIPLLDDEDAEVRAQSARLMGVGKLLAAQGMLDKRFMDPSARVRFHAIMAYRDLFTGFRGGGHRHRLQLIDSIKKRANQMLGTKMDVNGPSLTWPTTRLVEVLSRGLESDEYVRHAAVMLLTEIAKVSGAAFPPNVSMFGKHASADVRMALVLAYRRLGDASVAPFLNDSDPRIALETARAINDVPIESAYPALAALVALDGDTSFADQNSKPDTRNSDLAIFTLRRALNANFRLGRTANAQALANFAARDNSPEPLRVEALELLAQWPEPLARDHIMGLYRPLPARDREPAVDALRPVAGGLLTNAPADVRLAAIKTAATLRMKELDLYSVVADRQQSAEVRVEALKFLARLNDWRYVSALNLALKDSSELLRLAAAKLPGARFDVQMFKTAMKSGSVAEKQSALASLATASGETVDKLLAEQLDAWLAGTLPNELQLDVLEAVAGRPGLKPKLEVLDARSPKGDALASYRSTLHGGNAESGKKIFIENQQLACFRCHKIDGEGGDVGPDLKGLGEKKGREYLLEGIIQPNKEIAAGFESVLIDMKDGTSYAGLVKSETDTELVLNSPEDGVMTLKKSEIKSRQRGLSAMPEELATFMTRRELRDIIEFLATLK